MQPLGEEQNSVGETGGGSGWLKGGAQGRDEGGWGGRGRWGESWRTEGSGSPWRVLAGGGGLMNSELHVTESTLAAGQ